MKVIFRWVQDLHHEPVFLSVYRQRYHVFSSVKNNNTYNILKKHVINSKHMEYEIKYFTHLRKLIILKTALPFSNA